MQRPVNAEQMTEELYVTRTIEGTFWFRADIGMRENRNKGTSIF